MQPWERPLWAPLPWLLLWAHTEAPPTLCQRQAQGKAAWLSFSSMNSMSQYCDSRPANTFPPMTFNSEYPHTVPALNPTVARFSYLILIFNGYLYWLTVYEVLLVQGWEYDIKGVMLPTGRIQGWDQGKGFCFTKYSILDQILYINLSCVLVLHPLLSMYMYGLCAGISYFL